MKNFLKNNIILLLFLLLPLVFLLCLSVGSKFINPFGIDLENQLSASILQLRFYRIVTAFIVGAALAVSGVGYQAVLRNPLAEPFILGISGGASLGTALAIITGLAAVSYIALPFASFAGAVIVLALVLLMARGAGFEYTNNIMLSGVIAGSVCSSLLMFIISISGSHELNSIAWWMLGNLQPHTIKLMVSVLIIVLAGTFILFIFGRDANLISMGEETAHSLGINPYFVILLILGISSLMAASAVALSGIIGFVGLIIPHILRRLAGADHRKLFPAALLGGGIFVMLCDSLARTVLSPVEIPVGVITSLTGGPFFLYILNRRRKFSNE